MADTRNTCCACADACAVASSRPAVSAQPSRDLMVCRAEVFIVSVTFCVSLMRLVATKQLASGLPIRHHDEIFSVALELGYSAIITKMLSAAAGGIARGPGGGRHGRPTIHYKTGLFMQMSRS